MEGEAPEEPVAEDEAEGSTGAAAGPAGTESADRATASDEAADRAPVGDQGGGDSDGPADLEVRDSGSGSRFGGLRHTVAFAAAVTVLLLGGSAFFHGAHQLRSAPSARNHALTDTAATERVNGEVGDGLARIFSYTPTGADATARSARTVLGGKAARQYDDLFAELRAKLETQKITLNTQAVRTGTIELDGDTARLLVLLDQTSRRDGGAATSAAAQLTVTAHFHDDRWQIIDIKAR
ncbi:hypothetical protein M8Z33_28185 [Streptomyces sp. ZAF1911]|uniref:hypothetical protein n=1 Tax=Streptomyces sp. ZAF1911 TaxID=2944129 RepID=UPI00237C32CF|nr:hypothetical protein [Streptomyces sp. ZAF1911]MDD9380466.1 hypothetical protein [Streptomyces sp. ZAF1911]